MRTPTHPECAALQFQMDNNFDFTIITSYDTGIPEIRNYELHDNRQVTVLIC